MSETWQEKAERELTSARDALQAGLGGRSRVSARRAAGVALNEYYRQQGIKDPSDNYYHLLLRFSEYPALPDNIRTIARHLCQRVDENYSLPDDINLVKEAEQLIQYFTEQMNMINKR